MVTGIIAGAVAILAGVLVLVLINLVEGRANAWADAEWPAESWPEDGPLFGDEAESAETPEAAVAE